MTTNESRDRVRAEDESSDPMSQEGGAGYPAKRGKRASSTRDGKPAGQARPKRYARVRSVYSRHHAAINWCISILLAVGLWQLVAAHMNPLVLVPLQQVWQAFISDVSTGGLATNIWSTFEAFLLAFVLSAVIGVLIGMLMSANRAANEILDPWISALYATPLIAVAPLFIVIFGLGLSTKIAVAFLMGVLPVAINTSAGIRTTDPGFVEAAYSFGAGKLQIFQKVLIPAALPMILTGLRLAIGRALIGVVVAEFFGSNAGLGHMVFISAQDFDTANVYVGMLILMAIGMILFKIMHRIEAMLTPWRKFRVP